MNSRNGGSDEGLGVLEAIVGGVLQRCPRFSIERKAGDCVPHEEGLVQLNVLLLVDAELLLEFMKLLLCHVHAEESSGLLEELVLGLQRLHLLLLGLDLRLQKLVLLVHLGKVLQAIGASDVRFEHRNVLGDVVLALLLELVLEELLQIEVPIRLPEH